MGFKEIGDYILTETIYETANRALYKAINSKNDRFYIVKEYKGNGYDEQLKNEMKKTSEIEKNAPKTIVIPVSEVLQNRYLVMEYKHQGIFLSEYMNLDFKENDNESSLMNMYIVRELLDSLKVLHTCGESGYVHMDIHPGNVFLENIDFNKKKIGVARFLDFGKSVKAGDDISLVESKGYFEVNLHYASPEVKLNRSIKASVQSDIYSAAVIAEELLRPSDCIMKCFVERFLKPGLQSSKDYRYYSCDEMLDQLEVVIEAEKGCIEKNYYDVLDLGYEYMIPIDKMVFEGDIDIEEYEMALTELEGDLTTYQTDPERCMYIFEGLKNISEAHEGFPEDIINRLNIAGVACCNHTGNALRAVELYEGINLDAMELMALTNLKGRIAVSYADIGDYNKAIDILDSSIAQMKVLSETMKAASKMAGARYSGLKELGRAYSALGTYIQSSGQDREPEGYFRAALKEFTGDEGNSEITQIHILQYAAYSRNRNLYEEFEDEIFENGKGNYIGDLEDCIYNRQSEEDIDIYRLLTSLKAIYYLGQDIENKLDKVLRDTISAIKHCSRIIYRHPVELIWRYLGFLVNDNAIREECFDNAVGYIHGTEPKKYNKFNIITGINYKTLWLYSRMNGNESECEKLIMTAAEHAERDGYHIFAEQLKERGSMDSILTGEYD